MKRLLILGAGGHGSVVADAASEMDFWDEIAFLDDRYGDLNGVLSWPVIGRFAQNRAFRDEYPDALVAIGDNRYRMEMIKALMACEPPFDFPVIMHPSAVVSRSATIGPGTVVMANAVLNPGATIGSGCIINTSATVEHDCVLAAGVHVGPGARIAGGVRVGERAWIGMGSCVLQGVKVGDEATIGAGAVVLRDVSDKHTVVGNPAKSIGEQND